MSVSDTLIARRTAFVSNEHLLAQKYTNFPELPGQHVAKCQVTFVSFTNCCAALRCEAICNPSNACTIEHFVHRKAPTFCYSACLYMVWLGLLLNPHLVDESRLLFR